MLASRVVVLWHKIVLSPPVSSGDRCQETVEMEFIQFAGFHKFPSSTHADSAHTGISLVRLDRSFRVTVWTIDTGNCFLSVISGVSCSCSVYTDIVHLLNLQMRGCGFVCAMLDLSLNKNNI